MKRWRWALLAAGVAAMVCIGIAIRPARPQWTQSATRIAEVHEAAHTARGATVFVWLSDNEILFPSAVGGLLRKRIDRGDGATLPVSVPAPLTAFFWKASPDGRKLAWFDTSRPGAVGLQVASLNTTAPVFARPMQELLTCWRSDGSALLTAGGPSGAASRRLSLRSTDASTGRSITFTVPQPVSHGPAQPYYYPVYEGIDRSLLLAGGGTLFVRKGGKLDPIEFAMADRSTDGVRQWQAPIPHVADNCYGSFSVSPDGRRLLWMVACISHSPIQSLLGQIVPGYRALPTLVYHLTVTDLQGGHPQELGMQVCNDWDKNRGARYESEPKWSPDSKRVGFLSQGGLYVYSIK